MAARSLATSLMRRKAVEEDHMTDTSLARVLGVVDLCCLAVGSTLGLGIYVLAGDVAKTEAGPAVVISFLVAALASLFAALCYAEFAARVPKAGSAYVYSYVCVGEFVAFVIGWNLILEYVIGTASVARGYSTYVDSIFDQAMQKAFTDCCGMNVPSLSAYPDFFAFFLVLMLAVLLAIGVRESTRFNNVFTFANLVVVIYVIITGSFKADGANWRINPEEVPDWDYDAYGTGGFMPFGFGGVMAGAARCFYGFVGFDAVATTGEEAKNPQRSIPLAIIVGLTVIFFSYFGVSAVLTLMWPYYLQDEDAPIPAVFEALGWESARWIVTIGALFGLSSSLLGALFPLPRILYAMAKDGLIFRWMANIHPRFQTPFWSTMLAGVFAAAMAAFFDLEQLVDMMSIGTLLAYSLVAVCVLVLRYRDESLGLVDHEADAAAETALSTAASTDLLLSPQGKHASLPSRLLNLARQSSPSHQSAQLVNHVTMVYGVITIAFCAVLVFAAEQLTDGEPWAITLTAVLGAAMIVCVIIVTRQPESKAHLFFKVPLVPYLPMLSVFVNVYLMMKLGSATWIRFAIWMVLGLAMYFGYGLRHSAAAAGAGGGKGRSKNLQLSQLEVPTIVVEPATPLQRSADGSPNLADRPDDGSEDGESSDGAGSEPAGELIVETAPDELEEEVEVAVGREARSDSAGDALDQERTVLMVTQTVQRQKGLHATITAALQTDGGDSGRGRQMALTQQQMEVNRLEQGYEPPPRPHPAAAPDEQLTAEMALAAERQQTLHVAVAHSLGAPADGTPAPIMVSAEVHSEAPETEVEEEADCVTALLAGGPPDPRRRDELLTNHWRRYESGAGEPASVQPELPDPADQPPLTLPDGFTEEVQRLHEAVEEQMAAPAPAPAAGQETDPVMAVVGPLHAAVCECFNSSWVDLGRGAALADEQRSRETARGSPPPPPASPPPSTGAAGEPLTAEQKQQLGELHAAIVGCLAVVRTPPSSPTSNGRPQPPMALGSTQRPLQRVLSNSSFQNIPPQSPDSPLARRVGDKFVIIPVSGDEDSEREDEPLVRTPVDEVRRAMLTVQDEVLTAMARATDGSDDGENEEEESAKEADKEEDDREEDGKDVQSEEDEKEDEGPTSEARRAMDSVLGQLRATSEPETDDSDRRSVGSDRRSVGSDEPAAKVASDGEEPATQPTPEIRRAMDSVLSQMTSSAAPGGGGGGGGDGPEPAVGGDRKRNQVAAPPEPSMKDRLDQIIKEAVEKAAKRVAEAPSDGEEGEAPPPQAPEPGPESPPVLENIGDGMHRIRSRKTKQMPLFNMDELMSRFDKQDA